MTWKFWQRKKKIIFCPKIAEACSPLSVPLCSEPLQNFTSVCKTEEVTNMKHPLPLSICEKCGACCAFFAVNFPDQEKDDLVNGVLLNEMSLPAGHLLRVMRGTEGRSPRCAALEGEVGKNVHCLIYAGRPSTCRNFKRSWENNIGNTLCDRARAVYGMQPFSQY